MAAITSKFQDDLKLVEESVQNYNLTSDLTALDDAIAAWERILNHPYFPQAETFFIAAARNDAGNLYLQRYRASGRILDLNRALELFQQVVAATPEGHPDLAMYLNNLGNRLRDRYQLAGFLDDLEEATRIYKQAIAATPEGNPDLATYLTNLGAVLIDRYQCKGFPDDLEEAIRVSKQVVIATPKDHPNLSSRLNSLGSGLAERYNRTGFLDDLEEEIRVFRQAVTATPKSHPNLGMNLSNLGNGLLDRFKRSGNLDDLEEAITVFRQAVTVTPKDHPNLGMYLNNLGTGLRYRFERSGSLDDLEESIKVCRLAITATTKGNPCLAGYLNNLGNGLLNRFKRSGGLDDLEESIKVYRQAVAATPKDHPDLAVYLSNLGNGLIDRYQLTGLLGDLEEAIVVSRQAVAATPKDHPDLAMYLSNLGNGLTDRYQLTGLLDDLEEVIWVYRQAVAATPNDHSDLAKCLNNLGTGLTKRFQRIGLINDLDEAIRLHKKAAVATPRDHPDLAMYLNNLGNVLRDRYQRTRLIDDLDEAIKACKQAVAATPEGHTDLAKRLSNLGNGLTDRHQSTGRIEDLEEAIMVFKQAVAVTPEGHTEFARHLSNLGNALRDRYQRTSFLDDLEESIKVCKRAVEVTPKGHTEFARRLNNYGQGLANRYQRMGLIDDLEEAKQSFRQACDLGLLLAPEETTRAGSYWQRWAFQRGAWSEVVEANGSIQQGMEQRLSHQFSRVDKSFSLEGVQGLAAQVSYARLRLDQLGEAVESLEAGRARLMREALERERRDLYRLQELGFKDLHDKFIEASGRYDALLAQGHSENRPVDWVEQLEGATKDMQSAAESIRKNAGAKHPEYRFFLKSLPLEEIQNQAREAPLVYLAATSSGGMALIVNSTRLEAIELPELGDAALRKTLLGQDDGNDAPQLGGYLSTYGKWRDNSRDLNALADFKVALEETTRWLWDTIMVRVLAHLEAEDIREAVLIPIGLLGLLPLHAAWTEDQSRPTSRRYALDNFTFTYAPSAQALYHAREGAARPADTLLAVENPDGTLRFAEDEVKAVLDHFQEKSTHLLQDQASKDAVVKAIEFSQVLHFSTHGMAGWQEAESSRLKLAGGNLTLTELFGLHLDQARLAVLSACETGVPGTRLPDEVVSLPSALMQAGVPGVIGSLWSVLDIGTAMLMAQFYDLWRDDHLSPPEALRRAQIWLRNSAVEELKCQFKASIESKGLPMNAEAARSFYEEIGWMEPNDRLFDHPFYWAAFGYTGL